VVEDSRADKAVTRVSPLKEDHRRQSSLEDLSTIGENDFPAFVTQIIRGTFHTIDVGLF
jgi:hypothetical protein